MNTASEGKNNYDSFSSPGTSQLLVILEVGPSSPYIIDFSYDEAKQSCCVISPIDLVVSLQYYEGRTFKQTSHRGRIEAYMATH